MLNTVYVFLLENAVVSSQILLKVDLNVVSINSKKAYKNACYIRRKTPFNTNCYSHLSEICIFLGKCPHILESLISKEIENFIDKRSVFPLMLWADAV